MLKVPLHTEGNLDRLGLLSPTRDQRYQQQSGKITLQSVLINKSKFLKITHRTKVRKIEIPRSMMVEGLELVKPAREPASSRPKPCASLKKPHESCPFSAPCGPRRKKKDRGQTSAFPSENLPVHAFDSRAQGFSPPPDSPTIELPSAFAESDSYPSDRAHGI